MPFFFQKIMVPEAEVENALVFFVLVDHAQGALHGAFAVVVAVRPFSGRFAQKFIDQLRLRNGNLEIALGHQDNAVATL